MLDYGIKKLIFVPSNQLTYKLLLYRVTLKSNTHQNFYWSHVSSSDCELLRFKRNPAVGENTEVFTEVFLGAEERHWQVLPLSVPMGNTFNALSLYLPFQPFPIVLYLSNQNTHGVYLGFRMIFHSVFKGIFFRFNDYIPIFKTIIMLFQGNSNMAWIRYGVDK
jgi:hypothetical protein